jgi:hypothetical protein
MYWHYFVSGYEITPFTPFYTIFIIIPFSERILVSSWYQYEVPVTSCGKKALLKITSKKDVERVWKGFWKVHSFVTFM